MNRLARFMACFVLVLSVSGCNSSPKPDDSASKDAATADEESKKRAQEIVAELHARVPKNAHPAKKPSPRLPSADAVSEIGPTMAPVDPSAALNPRFAGISSEDLYAQLIQIQAHWMDTPGRQEWFEAAPILQKDSRKVVSLVHSDQLAATVDHGHAAYQLNAKAFSTFRFVDHGVEYPLCADEPYLKQPMGAFCSGVLVGDKLVATAAHCIGSDDEAKATKFVFDFRMNDKDHPQSIFDGSEVYTGKQIVQSHITFSQDDWEIVELEQGVSEKDRIAQIRRDGKLDQTHKVFAIGYPSGLPVKVSAGGNVRDNVDPKIFLAGLDVYAGSSGGPVFNENHVVEGILARGDRDFCSSGKLCKDKQLPERRLSRRRDNENDCIHPVCALDAYFFQNRASGETVVRQARVRPACPRKFGRLRSSERCSIAGLTDDRASSSITILGGESFLLSSSHARTTPRP